MTPQILSIALAAGLALPARIPDAPSLKGVTVGPAAGAPQVVFAVSLKDAAAAQAASGRDVALGGVPYRIALGLADGGELPLVVTQGGARAAWTWAELAGPRTAAFPGGTLTAGLDGNWLTLSANGASERVWLSGLMGVVFRQASHAAVPAVDYAVLVQGDPADPDAVGLLRRTPEGNYFLAYRARAEMAGVNWFVAVNDVAYGMRPERGRLVFYEKPLPPAAKRR
ncbi:MAG: hypothetical protein KGL53_00060 [Elusimicrobia bacterium]|nr:hypothetical protein [Elusimicrobiota bacterium]